MNPEFESAIIAALPEATRAQPDELADVRAVLAYCAAAVDRDAGWPHRTDIEPLRRLQSGYGCWLGELDRAIEAAELDDGIKSDVRAAFGATLGLIQVLHIP